MYVRCIFDVSIHSLTYNRVQVDCRTCMSKRKYLFALSLSLSLSLVSVLRKITPPPPFAWSFTKKFLVGSEDRLGNVRRLGIIKLSVLLFSFSSFSFSWGGRGGRRRGRRGRRRR
ncbi:hypothetical protein F4775DRAFT_539656 [Biscogniauxia sp. FL1348]|nr:hypothetical protein F4775DRAFT_539656 [Biscogniauxia sp. FL1348]